MKQKILKALKTRYASKGLSDKALDGVAAFLEKTVTEEGQIDAAISEASVEALINVYQSEADALRNQKAQAEKALADYKAAHPDKEPDPAKKGESDEAARELQELKDSLDALKKQLDAANIQKRNSELISSVRDALKADNRDNDALLDIVFKNPVIGEGDTVDALKERYAREYDGYYGKLYGDGAVPSIGNAFAKLKDGDKSDFSGVVCRLRSEGKLAPVKTDITNPK